MSAETEIIERLDRLESLILQSLGKKKTKSDLISWAQVAVKLGIEGKAPSQAARRRVHRARDGGAAMRVTRNGVSRVDFERWLDGEFKARPSQADKVRRALAGAQR